MNQENNKNQNNLKNYKSISKRGKALMFGVLISILIIIINSFLTSMNWFQELQNLAFMLRDDDLKLLLETIVNFVGIMNWIIILVITAISIIFLIKDKKEQNNTRMYEWYIVSAIIYVFIGYIWITLLLYYIITLLFAIENKKKNKLNNLNFKSDNVLLILSLIPIVVVIFLFIKGQIETMPI